MRALALGLVLATLAAAFVSSKGWRIRRGALRRIEEHDAANLAPSPDVTAPDSGLARWLSRAGYRDSNAPATFLLITAAAVGVGIVSGQIYTLALLRPLVEMVANAPGSTADVLAAILQGGPWILFLAAASAPAVVVRAKRRRRVRFVEQDLPLTLELFATMAEAGLGFDAALAKILRARGSGRPLMTELVNFQVDVLAGVPRVQALRQLARRVDVPALTRFTSALIHAEQAGAGMSETLQHQADDLRQRRREDALLQAQALPVKLVFPLVICFLPGIFASTLAPVIYQIVQVADGVLRSTGR